MIQRTKRTRVQRIGSWLDGAISAVAPTWAARRTNARLRTHMESRIREAFNVRVERLKRSWDGAESTTQRGDRWLTSGFSPDEGLEQDLPELQKRCADLYRNSGIAHSAIEGRVANEVGIGITPQARIMDDSLGDRATQANREIESVIRRWSEAGVDEKRRL